MSADNQTDRISKFLKWWQQSIHTRFLRVCYHEFQQIEKSEYSDHIFVCLENDIYKAWNSTMNSMLLPDLITVVEEKHLEKVMMNAGGLLYYIAGWLLMQLHKFPVRGLQARCFAIINFNSLEVGALSEKLPTGTLESREKHIGKLKRVTPAFYRLVEIIEAIYMENLENPQVVWALKDNLFVKLLKVTKQSFQIESAFDKCYPPPIAKDCPTDAAQHKVDILNYLLGKYNAMRAGDYIKKLKLKALSTNEVEDNFSVRSALLAAQLMAKGQTPSAITK